MDYKYCVHEFKYRQNPWRAADENSLPPAGNETPKQWRFNSLTEALKKAIEVDTCIYDKNRNVVWGPE